MLIFSGSFTAFCAKGDETSEEIKTVTSVNESESSYFNYYTENSAVTRPEGNIKISPDKTDTEIEKTSAVTLGKGKNKFTAEFEVENSGAYYLRITYRTLEDDSSDITAKLRIDGEYPFDEAAELELTRLYEDDTDNGEFDTDKLGNDIRPASREIYRWQTRAVADTMSLYSEPYLFVLEKGKHKIEMESENVFAVASAEFYNDSELMSYESYLKQYEGAEISGEAVRQEAEKIYEKNTDNIYPTYEKTDASTLPISPSTIKLNTVGQSNWSRQGQLISWKCRVERAGLYSISLRVNQSYNENGSSYRRLLVNGEVPFAEADCIEFPYSVSWYTKTLGDKEPYYVYLEPGDIITLEATVDKTADISRNINSCLTDLSSVYRKIFVITGASPDVYVDYNLDVKIPTLMNELESIKKQLEETINLIIELTGKKTSAASTLSEILETVTEMIEKPYDIHRYVSDISDHITNMGSLVTSIGQQPLELDCFYFTPSKGEIPSGKASFFKRIKYAVERFLCSYTSTYGALSENTDSLKVWISTGRDQLSIIQQKIEEDFENNHNIDIDLSLVDTGSTLLKATISGKGPDVALTIDQGTPINLAMRDALVDLSKYDLSSIKGEFYDSAWEPYRFKDGIYAIPETATFDVMFYRTDVFEMLGIEAPETWDDFYAVLKVLQSNNYEVGIPEVGANAGISAGIGMFARLLLQKGGTYYTDDFKKTAFDTDAAYAAFSEWVDLYKKYSLDRSFDFFNRFRTGVMALSIQGYSSYNQLYSAAPEIRGQWAMAPVPGTKTEDGSINRAQNSSGAGCIMLKSAEEKGLGEEAFEFMKWWTSSDTQSYYANELEATMGIAARYTPANVETLKNMNWKSSELSVLLEQFEQTVNFREVPGNYVLSRSLTSALRKALSTNDLPERQLELYNKDINEELERKAKEFDLY